MSRRQSRSGNPAAPAAPKVMVVNGNLGLVSNRRDGAATPASPTGHRWIVTVMHLVDPAQPTFYLDERSIADAQPPRCAHCGAGYSPDAAARYCPGVPQPTAQPTAPQPAHAESSS